MLLCCTGANRHSHHCYGATMVRRCGRAASAEDPAAATTGRAYILWSPSQRNSRRGISLSACFQVLAKPVLRAAQRPLAALTKHYVLPDGHTVHLGDILHRCPEALFDPSIVNSTELGIHEMINTSVLRCDANERTQLFASVVLAGGNTNFSGLEHRLESELRKLRQSSSGIVNVIAPANRQQLTWTGGSILASLSTFQPMWISKTEYQESGPQIVHRKCF